MQTSEAKTEAGWITQLRTEGFSVGQDREGFYRWITPKQTSMHKAVTEGDAWAAARTHRNLTRKRIYAAI